MAKRKKVAKTKKVKRAKTQRGVKAISQQRTIWLLGVIALVGVLSYTSGLNDGRQIGGTSAGNAGGDVAEAGANQSAGGKDVDTNNSASSSSVQPTPQPTDTQFDENYAGGYGVEDPHEIFGGENPPISVSGGNLITTKTEIWVYPDGWSRLVKAENGAGTSWSNLWKIEADDGVTYYWPHPWELRVEGTGVFQITLRPDNTEGGYNSSDLHGLGLAFWISGNHASVEVSRDGGATWLDPSPYQLTTGSAGIDFPLEGGEVTIRLTLQDGIVYLPLGESVPTGDLPLWQ